MAKDLEIRVGILPQSQEILVGGPGLGGIAREGQGPTQQQAPRRNELRFSAPSKGQIG